MASAENLELLEAARREYRSLSVVETRAALTRSKMGTAVKYGPSGLAAAAEPVAAVGDTHQ